VSTSPSVDWVDYVRAAVLPEVRLPFEFLAAMQHEGAWTDVAAKAKRLVQEGKVTILRNAPHHVMSHVQGDHGEYNCEISRHDPNSQVIEQWNCECPWAQYAFDRTRKWKKLEGRVCSHVLATYWKPKSTPLDMSDQDDGYAAPGGQAPGAMPGQEQLPLGPTQQQPYEAEPGVFTPETTGPEYTAPEQPETPPDATQPTKSPIPMSTPSGPLPGNKDIALPGQPQNPFSTQPSTTPVAPPQKQQLQLFDITAPQGMQPTPQAPAVSVPGARPPTPGNPVQLPGTFSHFIPTFVMYSNEFVYASDNVTDYFEQCRAAHQPILVALTNPVLLERSGGKMPMPSAQPYGHTSEGIPMYRVMDLGYNPATGQRENSDVNALQGAPEQQSTYSDVPAGKRAEVIDFDPNLKMAYIMVTLDYPDGGDVRLHPHALKGWVDYADVRPMPAAARNRFNR
jgi:hypothetical protein